MLAKSLKLKNRIKIPRLGQGTWFMAEIEINVLQK